MKNADALKQKKLFLFDIDGTLAIGDTLYKGSADLLKISPRLPSGHHRGPVHHLRLYDYPVFKGKLC